MAYQATAYTEAKKAEAKARILKAGRHIVAKQGFKGISVSAVAQEAGLATGSVYRHFANKADLCREIFIQATQYEVDQVAQACSIAGSNKEKLINGIKVFAERALKGRRLAYALMAEPVAPEVEAQRLIYREAYAAIFSQLLEKGIAAGEFVDQYLSLSAAAIVGTIAETLIVPLSPSVKKTTTLGKAAKQNPEQLIQAITQFVVQAISARPYPD